MRFLKLKRLLALLTVTVLTLSLLAGCGGTGTTSSDVSAPVGDVSTAPVGDSHTQNDNSAVEGEDSSSAESGDSTSAGGKTTTATDAGGDNATTTGSTTSSRRTVSTTKRSTTTTAATTTTKKVTTVEKTPAIVTSDPTGVLDYIVEVKDDRDIVVLQLTDPQIIDAAQERTEDRLGDYADEYWATDKMEDRCFQYMRETIKKADPDLILLTGDLVYGAFDDAGTSWLTLIEFMESFDIPWAPVYGNHDSESAKGVTWQCQQLEVAENCLFKQRTLTGNGNYSIGLKQGGTVKRVIFMLDSNGYNDAGHAHSSSTPGFGADQIAWYTGVANQVKKSYPSMKFTFAFHIQMQMFATAYAKYGFTNSGTKSNPINLDEKAGVADGDFGYIGRDLKNPWDADGSVYKGLKALGTDSILVGHEHCNSASVVYDGIRFQYGQKCSTYDRANYKTGAGAITGSYSEVGEPVMGGTVMVVSKTDGAIKDAYIQYWDE